MSPRSQGLSVIGKICPQKAVLSCLFIVKKIEVQLGYLNNNGIINFHFIHHLKNCTESLFGNYHKCFKQLWLYNNSIPHVVPCHNCTMYVRKKAKQLSATKIYAK